MKQESGVEVPRETRAQFSTLHRVSNALRQGDLEPAFRFVIRAVTSITTKKADDLRLPVRRWVQDNRAFLQNRRSPLEFHLHRSQYVRLLLSDTYPLPAGLASSEYAADPAHATSNGSEGPSTSAQHSNNKGASRALRYARAHLGAFHAEHSREIKSLSAATLYLPIQRLLQSPYAHLLTSETANKSEPSSEAPSVNPAEEIYHAPHLIQLFASEYCSSINMSHDLPLKVVTDIGGGGALAKIAKVKGVMKEKRTEWTTVQELPVEIPLPPQYRYHSVFACPVSKEQATDTNPPMMMPCGHVVANQTLMRLCKGGQ